MKYTVFKANPKSTGAIANLRTSKLKNDKKNVWEERLFLEMLPQKGWNDSNKTGSFDPDKKQTVMINPTEAGDMVNTILNGIPFDAYHQSGDGPGKGIKLAPFKGKRKFKTKDGEKEVEIQKFGLQLAGKGFSISAPLDPGEVQCLRVLLENYIKNAIGLDASEESKKYKSSGDSSNSTSNDEEDTSTEDDVDDVPF